MAVRVSGLRLFAVYALASALPMALLGLGLSRLYEVQMDRRALDQAQGEAGAIANAGIAPVMAGRDLSQVLTEPERASLATTTQPLLRAGTVLRLRLRDRTGAVVFDGAHPEDGSRPDHDDEAERAASGHAVRKLTRLNGDGVDAKNDIGARAVEAYIPVRAGGEDQRVLGVLEIYLPYAPIAHSFAASTRAMLVLIGVGLAALWMALSLITWSATKRLRRSAAENEYQALHDHLTGLPNRALFGDRAAQAISSARRSGQSVGIAIIDLDRFKDVNDTLGHHNGDAYLRHVAAKLSSVLRPGDTIARLGGDEFGLVLPGTNLSSASAILERAQATLATDVEIEGIPVTSEASIGIAFWPSDGDDLDELLPCADLAMYAAKHTHSAITEYTSDLAHFSPARLALVSQLRRAIAHDELVLHYQPKLDLHSNHIVSVEALLRWQHPTRGLLAPAEFLEVAESTGLIDPLTDWVLDHAIAQTARWRQRGLVLGIAVNVSARNLRNDSLPTSVFERLDAHGVEPELLQVEITETALITDPVRATRLLQQLRDKGVRVSLDDFGQGYTSLSQLGRLPLAELKIDRSFVANMLTSPSDRTIVTTVIELGHNLGLEVVAEGVETPGILRVLTDLGCDTAQGWVLTPALPAEQVPAWIRDFDRTAEVTGALQRR